jgi:hypothetical protein
MRTALATIVFSAVCILSSHAQTKGMEKADSKADEVQRLESITWDLKTHTLKWTVQKGTDVKGEFQAASAQHYEISPDVAMMKVADEKRGIEHDEAALLHRLLDTLSIYCAESVVWWDHGEGGRITDDADRSGKPDTKPGPKPTVKPTDARPKALPLGVAEVAAHPVVR